MPCPRAVRWPDLRVEPQGETERLQSHQHALPGQGDPFVADQGPAAHRRRGHRLEGTFPEVLTAMRDGLEKMKLQGVEAIND